MKFSVKDCVRVVRRRDRDRLAADGLLGRVVSVGGGPSSPVGVYLCAPVGLFGARLLFFHPADLERVGDANAHGEKGDRLSHCVECGAERGNAPGLVFCRRCWADEERS